MLPRFFTMPIYYTCHSIFISRSSPVKYLGLEMISHVREFGVPPTNQHSIFSICCWVVVSPAQMFIPTCLSPLVYHFCEFRSSKRQTSRWDSVCMDFTRENSFDVSLTQVKGRGKEGWVTES